MPKKKPEPEQLKEWAQIARFLGQPFATVQRWAKSGMPVRREGRYMYASPEELSQWLARESGEAEPVQIPTPARI